MALYGLSILHIRSINMDFLKCVLVFTVFSETIIGNIEADEVKNVEVSTQALDVNNLNSILNALKKYGPTKKSADQKGANQYTCTTVLAEEEVVDISWLRNGHKLEFHDNFKTNEGGFVFTTSRKATNTTGKILFLKSISVISLQKCKRTAKQIN